MHKQVNVAIIPNSPNFLQNRLFELDSLSGAHAGNGHWLQPMAVLRNEALKENIILNTYDLAPLAKTDIIVIMELPSSPDSVKELRRKSPRAKIIFMPVETPLGRRYIFNKANHAQFDAVLTYNPGLVDGKRYFPFYLPIADVSFRTFGESFASRKTACLVSTNPLLRLRTGFNVTRAGWRFSLPDRWDYVFYSGALISAKRSLSRVFERFAKGALDIYGDGWAEASFACAKGRFASSKLELLKKYRFDICFENCINDCGYISEKIFDALYGDTVPVYLGNKSIQQHIPGECFIDARKFRNKKELVRFICECPESVWEEYRKAGRCFLDSPALEKFLPSAFANNVLTPIRILAK